MISGGGEGGYLLKPCLDPAGALVVIMAQLKMIREHSKFRLALALYVFEEFSPHYFLMTCCGAFSSQYINI